MKKITILLLLSFLIVSKGLAQTFGGNLPALRPAYTTDDEKQFDLALSYIKPGNVSRVATIFWEVNWFPNQIPNYRGIDAAIQKMVNKNVIPLFLLMPTPYPYSPWYANGWNDWWLPSRLVWNDAIKANTAMALHIRQTWIDDSMSLYHKVSKSNQPLFQIWNEPEAGKPGGSITSVYGEWTDTLHEYLYLMTTDLIVNKIPKTQIVGPAISCLGENGIAVSAELLSCKPPVQFDWLSLCGYRAYHLRFDAPGANGDVNLVKQGFIKYINYLLWIDSKLGFPADQKLIMTEYYITPGNCGVPIGTDMYPYHVAAFEALKQSGFKHTVAWGLRDGEADDPNNPYAYYGGVGKSLQRWQNGG